MNTLSKGSINIAKWFLLLIGLYGVMLMTMLWYTSDKTVGLNIIHHESKHDAINDATKRPLHRSKHDAAKRSLHRSKHDAAKRPLHRSKHNAAKRPLHRSKHNATKRSLHRSKHNATKIQFNDTVKRLTKKIIHIPRPDDYPRRLYLEHGTGRLGNKLFHVAAAICIANANNMTVYLPYDTEVIRIFNITQFKTYTPHDYDNFNNSGADILKIKHISYEKDFMKLEWEYHVKLYHGGVQTHLYFWEKYQPLIRSLYVFNNFIKYHIDAFMDGLQKKYNMFGTRNITYVGIHCRRGDRAYDQETIKNGYKATPLTYFQKAINFTLARYKTPIIYVVATDDREWTTKNLKTPGENTFIEHTPWGLNAEHDMGILSRMNHTIMSTGSFGWWCSYLAGGDVVYLNNPFTPKSQRDKLWRMYFQTQMYPNETNWIGMSD